MEAVYITVAILGGLGLAGGATYKCTQNNQRHIQRVEVNHPNPPSPLLDKIVRKSFEQHSLNSDETDIDIKIHIQNHVHEKDVK